MAIPNELLQKYHMNTLEGYIQDFGDDGEYTYWYTFLCQTDHIPNKLIEGSCKTEDCAEELYWREFARQELAKLNGEEPSAVEEKRTLEERTTDSEAFINALLGMEG